MIWDVIKKGRSDIVLLERYPDSEKSGYTVNSYLTILRKRMSRIYESSHKFM